MPWHKIALPVDRVAAGHGIRLMDEVEALFVAAGFPKDAAVFGNVNAGPGATHFFNPEASVLASGLIARWGGVACDDPGEPVALLIGHQDDYYKQNKSQRPQ